MKICCIIDDEINNVFQSFDELYDWINEIVDDGGTIEELNYKYGYTNVPTIGDVPTGELLKRIVCDKKWEEYRKGVVDSLYKEIVDELKKNEGYYSYDYDFYLQMED